MGYFLPTISLAIVLFAGQTPTGVSSFEVVSVKRNNSVRRDPRFETSPGRFLAQNVTLRMLIQYAYDLADFSLNGGPDWINVDRYDVEARAADRTGKRELEGPMLRRLLEDRFKLVVRREQKDSSIYVLTVAKGGPILSEESCVKRDQTAPSQSSQSPLRFCGSISHENNVLKATQITSAQLAEELSHWLRRTVIDRTGITRPFDVELRWNLNEITTAPPPDDAPSIFAALQEHLGLKLESTRGVVDVLVIDSVQRPSEN